MSYQRERDQFVATMTREGLPLWIAERLLREATGFQRRAELACNSEAADRDRVKCPRAIAERRYATKPIAVATKQFARYPCLCNYYEGKHADIPRITLQDWRAELRLRALLASDAPGWELQTAGDPRGYTLRVIPPSYAARNAGRDVHNLDSIGVPARETRLRF